MADKILTKVDKILLYKLYKEEESNIHHEAYSTFLEGEGRKDFGHLEEEEHKWPFISLVNSSEDSVKHSVAMERRSVAMENSLAATRSNSEDSVKHSVDTESR